MGGAYWWQGVRWTGHGDPVEVSVARGSASLLPMLGIEPALGRWFLARRGGDRPHRRSLCCRINCGLNDSLETSHVLGSTIDLEGRPFTVIGVLPAQFPFVSLSPFARPADRTSIWTPIGSWSGDMTEGSQNYEVIARLRPGVSIDRGPSRASIWPRRFEVTVAPPSMMLSSSPANRRKWATCRRLCSR